MRSIIAATAYFHNLIHKHIKYLVKNTWCLLTAKFFTVL